jgi:hypothetical protein
MKAKSVVQVRTAAGLIDAPCYFQWKQQVGGMDFDFALCVESGHQKGFQAPLSIHELSTGFNIKAVMLHPNSRNPLTDISALGMPSHQVKKIARAAFHRKIFKEVGQFRFLQSVVSAQMLIAKQEGRISKEEAAAGVTMEGHSPEFGAVQVTLKGGLPKLGIREDGVCHVCDGTKVVSTTEKDHEGVHLETACPECIPKPVAEVSE